MFTMFSASFNKRGLKTLILDQILQAQCKDSRNSSVSAKQYNNMEACVTQTYRIILSNLGFKHHPNQYEELAEHKAIWSIALCKRKLNPLKISLLFIKHNRGQQEIKQFFTKTSNLNSLNSIPSFFFSWILHTQKNKHKHISLSWKYKTKESIYLTHTQKIKSNNM